MTATRVTAKTLTATTSSAASTDKRNNGYSRGTLVVTITGTPSGTSPTATVKVQGKSKSGVYYDLPNSSTTALNAAGTTVVALATLPSIWRVVWTIAGTTPSIVLGVDVDAV